MTFGIKVRQMLAIALLLPRLKPFYRRLFDAMFAEWPKDVREPLVRYHLRAIRTGMAEAKNQSSLEAELVGGGDMPHVPAVFLSTRGVDRFQTALMPESYLRELNARKAEIDAPLVAAVPDTDYRTLEGAGHATLHTDRPDDVVRAVRDVISRITR
jgi:hypothetical protein